MKTINRKFAAIGFIYLFSLIIASHLSAVACFTISAISVITGMVILIIWKKDITIIFFVLTVGFGIFAVFHVTTAKTAYSLDGQELKLSGVVKERNYESNDTAGYIINTKIQGQKLSLLLHGTDKNVNIGDNVTFTGKISRFKSGAEFDAESYYFSRGILIKATAVSDIIVNKPNFYLPYHYIEQFNQHIKNRLKIRLPDECGAILTGIFLGDKTDFTPQMKINVVRSGLSHMMAVSGLHLTVILHLFMVLIMRFSFLNNRFTRFALLTLLIITLVIFFNMTASVIRAGIMILVYYGGDLFFRRSDTLNSLGFAIFLITLFSPYACLDIGLLMSAAGTFGIGVMAPYLLEKLNPKKLKFIYQLLLTSICPYLATIPLSAVYFRGFSLMAVISNIVIQPFFYVAFIMMLIFAILGGLANLPLLIAGLAAKIMLWLINTIGNLRYSYLSLNYEFLPYWLIGATIFTVLTAIIFNKFDKTFKSILLSICTLTAMITMEEYHNFNKPQLYIYSDGEGGAVFFQKGKTSVSILLNDSLNTYSAVLEYMNDNYIDELTFLCLLDKTNNYSQNFNKINSLKTILPDELSELNRYNISGILNFYIDGKTAKLSYDDIDISFSKIADAENYADIQILKGYKKQTPEILADRIIYLNKRQNPTKQNEFNAYYEKIKIPFK